GEYLQLEKTATAGASCSPNGLVGRDSTGAILSCQSGVWRALGGKLKVTQLSSTGYLGQFDFCAIARMGNAEDSHYCQVVESPSGSRKWYKYEHKTGCIASCVTLN
ncbi:shufflon system plasmid conjugative transfer pilus tip adhesin PilV, partial [Salmonella enterica]